MTLSFKSIANLKRLILLLVIVTVLPSFIGQNPASFSIVGRWTGTAKGTNEKIILIFDKEGYVSTIEDGRILNGKGYEIQGSKYKFTYKTDMLSTPLRMDMVMTDITNNQKVTQKGVFKINNPNEIVMVLAHGERVMNLKSKNAVTFKRKKM
jgi:hypothetical protein